MDTIDKRIRHDAIFLRLRENLLLKVKRGDLLTYEECEKHLDGDSFEIYRQRVKRHFARQGIDLIPVPGMGYRLATPEQQLHETGPLHMRKAIRQGSMALRSHVTTPDTDLSTTDKAHRQHAIERLAGTLARAKDDEIQLSRKLKPTNVKVDVPRLGKKPDEM
jgi:hypothetical protein